LTVNFSKLNTIKKNLNDINNVAKLLVVSKNQSREDILELLENNNFVFGENRVQEASKKFDSNLRIKYTNLKLHLIGPLQSNKVKLALKTFDVIQTLDRKKIIDDIATEMKKLDNIRTKSFYIQVNIGEEKQKSGVEFKDLEPLYVYAKSQNLIIDGLMCIPPFEGNPSFFFKKLKTLRDNINIDLKLSMGMSSDYVIALKEGSDVIRVGSLIFNE